MYILGINAFHGDSSAAILRDGKMVAAVEEERFRRIKHWAGFPSLAIEYCLEAAGIGIGDVDHLALNSDSSANLLRKITYTLWNRPDIRLVLDRLRNRGERKSLAEEVAELFPGDTVTAEFHNVEHHLAHLASAYYVSPFEEAVVDTLAIKCRRALKETGIGDLVLAGGVSCVPAAVAVWERAWDRFTPFLAFPPEVRRIIYTTNAIESFNYQIRKVIKACDNVAIEFSARDPWRYGGTLYWAPTLQDAKYTWVPRAQVFAMKRARR